MEREAGWGGESTVRFQEVEGREGRVESRDLSTACRDLAVDSPLIGSGCNFSSFFKEYFPWNRSPNCPSPILSGEELSAEGGSAVPKQFILGRIS